LKELIDYINRIEDPNQDVKDSIKNAQVPVRLSESMALNKLRDGSILILNANNHALFDYGNRRGGYDIEYPQYNRFRRINIEVKATGTKTFQRFRAHAMSSNVVIWIDFYGLRQHPTTTDYRIYGFRTNRVFRNFLNRQEKEISLNTLIDTYGIIPYAAGSVI
jgi:hypothetical protein